MLDLVFGGRRLIFNSPLSVEAATARLERNVAVPAATTWWQPLAWRPSEKGSQSFIGLVDGGRFQISRLIPGRTMNRPWIAGQLSRAANGCRVDVRLKMPTFALVAYLPFVALGLFIAFSGFFVIAGVLLVTMPFIASTFEARKATRLLATVFQVGPSRSTAVDANLKPEA